MEFHGAGGGKWRGRRGLLKITGEGDDRDDDDGDDDDNNNDNGDSRVQCSSGGGEGGSGDVAEVGGGSCVRVGVCE